MKSIISVCMLVMLAAVSAAASPDSFYSENLPSGVKFGMTPDQLTQARPEARKNDLIKSPSTGTESVAMVEIARQGKSGTAFWYRFKNGKLGAVSRSISTKNVPAESAQGSAAQTYNELRANFDLLRQEEVLRSTGASTFQLSAQLWEDKAKSLNIYFVASSQENTLIIFDPETFGSTDFFVPLDKRKEIDAQEKSVRDMLGESAPTPPPVIDLLPKVTKESTSTPVPAPEAKSQAAPVPTQQPQSTPPTTPFPPTVEDKSASPGFPIMPVAIISAVIVGIVIYLLRRKST
jgi:hypothetical protein